MHPYGRERFKVGLYARATATIGPRDSQRTRQFSINFFYSHGRSCAMFQHIR
jgi:hypothetical protein